MHNPPSDQLSSARGEALRAGVALLVVMVLFLLVANKLTGLQLEAAAASRTKIGRTVHEVREEPAPRGRIVDRHGRVLAEDVPGHEVRGEYYLTFESSAEGEAKATRRLDLLADELTSALLAGEDPSSERRATTRQVLRARIDRAQRPDRDVVIRPARATRPALVRRKLDFLVADGLRCAAAVVALHRLPLSRDWGSLHVHFQTTYERVYPGGDACIGPVGFIAERDRSGEVRQRLEAIDGLRAGEAGERVVLRAATKARFWKDGEQAPVAAGSITTTLDLDLQQAAQAELEAAVAEVVAQFKSQPSWGALVLGDVETGDVLAMASWVADSHPRASAFTPIQCVFEPGSSVKPLVLSMVLAHGKVDWDRERIDCSAGAPGRGWLVEPPVRGDGKRRRPIFDDHAIGVVSPHQVIVQSSNVGVVKLGLRLGPEGLDDYVETFQLSESTGLGLPGERSGGRKRNLPALGETMFWHYTGPSLCFGYEASVTAVQMLRAYMTMLSRRPRELRLLAAVEQAGVRVDLPPAAATSKPFLRQEDLDRIKAAMADVISKSPGSTGRHVAEMMEQLGFAPGVIAGKTGTSVGPLQDGSRTRTASFAGFAPVASPRYVAFCVLQKDRAEGFYGGRYAASAASRLLLRALGVLDTAGRREDAVRTRPVSRDPGRRTVTSAELQVGR